MAKLISAFLWEVGEQEGATSAAGSRPGDPTPKPRCAGWIPALVGLLCLGGTAWAQDPACVATDDQTQGSWIGIYGQCAHVLAAYNHAGQCEVPILTGEQRCEPPTCTDGSTITCDGGSFVGGVSPDLLDCRSSGDLDGDGSPDFTYDVYLPSGDGHPNRIPVNPDGSCSAFNGLWFADFRSSLVYTVTGLSAGRHRMAIYLMDWDSHVRRQAVRVCVGGDCSAPAQVDYDFYWGAYEKFDLNISAGDEVTVEHTLTGGANTVVSGVFFDSISSSSCADKSCWLGAGHRDLDTRAAWIGNYGGDGYVLFNRVNNPQINLTGVAAETTTLIGGFPDVVQVLASPAATTWLWDTTDSECGTGRDYGNTAYGWVWGCGLQLDPRPLVNPGTCDNAQNCAAGGQPVAATWDDAGERSAVNPNLFVDLEVTLPGTWRISAYAVDFDSTARRQRYHLYEWRTRTPVANCSPVDIGEFSQGKYTTWSLEGPFRVTLHVEAYEGINSVLSGLFVDPPVGETCRRNSCDEERLCTYTIGGWGARSEGRNPGWIREANWNQVYGPAGGTLVIGPPGGNQLTFTGAGAVEAFLPCGGPAAALGRAWTDPSCDSSGLRNTLASQVTALRLNVDYSCVGVLDGGCLAGVLIEAGPFAGMTVGGFLSFAESALVSGDTALPGAGPLSLSQINDAATALNERFDGCTLQPVCR